MILRNPKLSVGGVALDQYIRSVEVAGAAADVDSTTSGAAGKGRDYGLKDEYFKVKFKQNFNAAAVDATLAPLYFNETKFAVTVSPSSIAISSTNPSFSATNCLLLDYMPLTGDIGALIEPEVTFVVDGQSSSLTRATS